jgi:hypothetical protein
MPLFDRLLETYDDGAVYQDSETGQKAIKAIAAYKAGDTVMSIGSSSVLKEKSRCVHVAFPRLFIVHICFRN